jgi:hypothetical protein
VTQLVEAAAEYLNAGWPAIPVAYVDGNKQPARSGISGRAGRDLTHAELRDYFAGARALGLRCPVGTMAIDVDAYAPKRGAETLAEAERRWGPLPTGPWSSSRDDGVSRIRPFRVPPGMEFVGEIGFPELGLKDIETIQRHHRFITAWPSLHIKTGRPYTWHDVPGGYLFPTLDMLPELPATWIEALQVAPGTAVAGRKMQDGEVAAWLASLPEGECPYVARVLGEVTFSGSRYSDARDATLALIRAGEQGHRGVADAITELRARYIAEVEPDRAAAEPEFDRHLADGIGKVLATPTPEADKGCCRTDVALEAWTLAPAVVPGVVVGPPWTFRDVIGHHPFDPDGDQSDQGLAEAVAHRLYPGVRFCADTGSWLIRHREVWVDRRDDAAARSWAVNQLSGLMPKGDPKLPPKKADYTAENWAAVRRARFRSSAGAAAIGGRLRAMLADHHPSVVPLAELDADPEVLWAGGWPFSLRASTETPLVASWVDPNTPHLHTAACAPAAVPTPHWDAFVAAVWPDEVIRKWALRVSSVALTGHPDAVLPILYGRERSGKSTFVARLVKLLGSYAISTDASLMSAQCPPSTIADLRGRRLAFLDEGPKRGYAGTERLKQVTGGTPLNGALKYRNPITFEPTHTLVLTTNEEFELTDPALRARARILPCNTPEAIVRPAVKAMVAAWYAEAPGILAAMMREAAAYLADTDSVAKTREPAVLAAAEKDMIDAQQPLNEWLATQMIVVTDPRQGTPAAELRRQYCAWLEIQPHHRGANGRAVLPSPQRFGRDLTAAGVTREQHGGCWYWGVRSRTALAVVPYAG